MGFCNTPTGGLKVNLKRVKMPGYTGILSPRTYPSSSLPLQVADSLFKPTFAPSLTRHLYFIRMYIDKKSEISNLRQLSITVMIVELW